MAEISGEMVKEKVEHIEEVEPQYLIGADVSCLLILVVVYNAKAARSK